MTLSARWRLITACLAVLCWSTIASAQLCPMPPCPELLARPDGAAAASSAIEAARAPSVWQEGLDEPSAFDMAFYVAKRKGMFDAVSGVWGSPPDPSFNMLVILLRFKDATTITSPAFFDTLCFGESGRTVRTYWRDNSALKLDIVAVDLPGATGWFTAPETKAYYSGSNYGWGPYPHNAQKMVEDALVLAVAVGVDLRDYDNDGNGIPDGVTVVHCGSGGEYTGSVNDIWSHKWVTRTSPIGQPIEYATIPEYWTPQIRMTIGVIAHEWGHVFGLPDLYDTDNSSRGIGRWGLMSGGSWNGRMGDQPAGLCAWSRKRLGFADVITASPTSSSEYSIASLQTSGQCVRIWASGAPSRAYWLISLRGEGYWDGKLPAHGVMIEAVDDGRNGYNGNEWCASDSTHRQWPAVRIVQWDNRCDLEHNVNAGDSGDPWRAPSAFTRPRSDWYTGEQTGVTVVVVHDPDSLSGAASIRVSTCSCPSFGIIADWREMAGVVFFGALDRHAPTCNYSDYDLNCDGSVDSLDLQILIDRDYLHVPVTVCGPCSQGG